MDVIEFVNKAKQIHDNKYDYSLFEWKNAKTKIKIICPIHGIFEQKLYLHLYGSECPKCTGRRRFNKEWFIDKAKQIHNNKYDYSKVDYKNVFTKVIITCPIHGDFLQKPNDHINCNSGCPKCGRITSSRRKTDINHFLKIAGKIHGEKYDYSKVSCLTSYDIVDIICKKHGLFKQKVNDHLCGHGCNECAIEFNSDNNRHTTDWFINKAKFIHGDRYDYSKSIYTGYHNDLKIICPIHGVFEQNPASHFNWHGCKLCSASGAELEVSEYVSKYINIENNDRSIIKPQELDIYIHDRKLAIEYHGLYWHNDLNVDKDYHKNKCDRCFDKGIQLIQIFENEWLNKKEIVKSILNSKLGVNNKIFARKCEIKELTSIEFNEFCNNNHIQGKLNSVIRLGLIYNDKTVCVIGFNKHPKYDYECTRFCNELNINVIGGASRLFKYFVNTYKPNTILSFADRRYSNGGLYKTLGFELIEVTKPNYFYYVHNHHNELFSRQSFQKHKLEKKLKVFDSKLSEYDNMTINGYKRIFDAGHWKFVWISQNYCK